MATGNLVNLNKGKRRLGRFPVAPSRLTASRTEGSTSNSNKVHDDLKGNTDASFLTSFTASTDNTLLMEVEKMEAALGNATRNSIKGSYNSSLKFGHCQSKSTKTIPLASLRYESSIEGFKDVHDHVEGEECKKLSHVGPGARGGSKRSHLQSSTSSQKRTVPGQTPSNASFFKASVAAREKLNTPTASPLDKRQRCISSVLPVRKKAVRVSKHQHVFDAQERPKSASTTPQHVRALVQSPRQKGDGLAKGLDCLEISYSPLQSTPGGNSSVCDITTEESPPSASRSPASEGLHSRVQNAVKHNNQTYDKAKFEDTPRGRKNKTITTKRKSCKVKNSLDMIISPTKAEEECPNMDGMAQKKSGGKTAQKASKSLFSKFNAISPCSTSMSPNGCSKMKISDKSEIYDTPRRSTRISSVAKKRPSPTIGDSPKNVKSKTERKNKGKNEKPQVLKHKNTISDPGINTGERSDRLSTGTCLKSQRLSGVSAQTRLANVSSNERKSSSGDCPQFCAELNVNAPQARESSTVSQRAELVSTFSNTSVSEDKRQLAQWGLPEPVLEAYKGQGVTTMFEWQAECLLTDQVLDGRNLVFSAPTSAGKTLVAELLVLKRVVETRKKALFVLPFVSVAREKMYALQRLYQDAGVRVGGYMGSYSPPGGLAYVDVAVCTIEKGNGIINRLMEENKLSDLGVMVVDELHMVGDSHRGYLLELMLTKLAYVIHKAKLKSPEPAHHQVQLIGMSATLPNLDLLARWLDAALFCTDFRPVPLTEHIKVDNRILDGDLQIQREIPASLTAAVPEDVDHVIALCLETVTDGHAVLIFCPTKNWCEKLCETIARRFHSLTHPSQRRSSEGKNKKEGAPEGTSELAPWNLHLDRFKLAETVEQLKRCPVGVDPMLGRCLLNGVAYHHAGLTFDERDIVEGAFRQGQVKVLVATSTLSSGVNLPARRVIIRTPMFHRQVIDTLTYKQMAGRAGRKGVDTQGESIIICKPQERLKGQNLLRSDLPPVQSCLHFDPDEGLSRSLKRAVLEVVVSGVAPRPEDVMTYVNCTLLSASLRSDGVQDDTSKALVESCIRFLQDNEFVTVQKSTNEDGEEASHFQPTLLGSAILASSLSPDEGLVVFSELQKARRAFVLDTDLHIIYLVTPMYATDSSATLDWYHFHTLWESLTPADRRVAEMVGVSEAFIARAIRGRVNQKTETHRKQLAIHLRFYTALILDHLVREVPLMEVAQKFNYNKGQLQSLQQSSATYAGMITVLCGRLGWNSLELLLSSFQHRLSSGVQPELVDLVRVTALSATSARMLYNAGYTTVAQLARAKPADLEGLFRTSVPFQSDKQQEGETAWEAKERQRARCMWLTGRKGVTELEAAQAIVEEAKDIVQGDLGGAAISWESEEEEEVEEEEERGRSGEDERDERDLSLSTSRKQEEAKKLGKDDGLTLEAACFSKMGIGSSDVEKTSNEAIETSMKMLSSETEKDAPVPGKNPTIKIQAPAEFSATPVTAKETSEVSNITLRGTGSQQSRQSTTGAVENRREEQHKLPGQKRSQACRRRSSKSFDGCNSSLNHNGSFSPGSFRETRKSLFGQTVVSPPVGITRSYSKLRCDRPPSSAQTVERNRPKTYEVRPGSRSLRSKLAENLNSENQPAKTVSVLEEDLVTHLNPSRNLSSNKIDDLQTSKDCVENEGANNSASQRRIDDVHLQRMSLGDAKNKQTSDMMDNAPHSVSKESCTIDAVENKCHTASSQTVSSLSLQNQHAASSQPENNSPKVTAPPMISSANKSPDLNDFSFSASFDLDLETAKLVSSLGKSQKESSSATGSKAYGPEQDSYVCLSVTDKQEDATDKLEDVTDKQEDATDKLEDATDKHEKDVYDSQQGCAVNSTRSDPFCDSFSETLFSACDKITTSREVSEHKASFRPGKSCEASQAEADFMWSFSEDGETENVFDTEGDGENCDSNLAADFHEQEPEGEEEEDEKSSLIAASNFNRFENFDDGMMEDNSYDDFCGSFTRLKTRPGDKTMGECSTKMAGLSEHASSLEENAHVRGGSVTQREIPPAPSLYSNKTGSGHTGSNRRRAEDEEEFLLAALDLSSPFDASPFHGHALGQVENVPHNSTPVGSETNVIPPPNLSPQPCGETPTSHSSGARRFRQRKLSPLSTLTELERDTNIKSTQSGASNPLLQTEDCFMDSFSLTLVDRIMAECDNLQERRKNGDKSSAQQSRPSGKENKLSKESFDPEPDSNPAIESVPARNPDSANSSRHSDCVPPTPPGESASHASPLKMSFYSPLKSRPLRSHSKRKAVDSPTASPQMHATTKNTLPNSALKKASCNWELDYPSGHHSEGVSKCNALTKSTNSKSLQRLCETRTAPPPLQPTATLPQMSTAGKPTSPSIPPSQNASQLTQQSFTIMDVCANRQLFQSFLAEWEEQTSYSVAVACEKLPAQSNKAAVTTAAIGQKFSKKRPPPSTASDISHETGIPVTDSEKMVVGLAVSWENRDVYFVSLMPTGYVAQCDPDDSLCEPGLDESLTQEERVLAVTKLLSSKQEAQTDQVIVYDAKAVYITLTKSLKVAPARCEDPRVADWLLAPSSRLKNLHHMVASFCPEELSLLDAVGGTNSYGSIGLDVACGTTASQASGRLRACTECVLARALMVRYYCSKLAEEGLLEAFTDVEMPALLTLARMELNGFGICESELESQKTLMLTKLTALEERAYAMAGHVFSLTSTEDISKIFYSELKLPINGDPDIAPRLPSGRGQGRRGRGGGVATTSRAGSTSKEVLEKLAKFHPLPAVVLEWRRISSALTKSLFALQRCARKCARLDMPRVFGDCQIFTATGRVSMAEPNIQNIPKDFAIELPDYIGESPTASQPTAKVMMKKGSKLAAVRGDRPQAARTVDPDQVITAPVSMRKMFVPFKGGILLAADYSQLELRVIAHLSQDSKLAAVLNARDGDVFKMIAAQMHSVEVREVTPAQRQQAKQVCYGMLYGIGPKALGEQLGVEENDAGAFMEMFKSRYPGVRKYLRETVEFCQKTGYVKTMLNRRRYLPSIKHSNPHARAQAERQAVNTTVQGSAADLVKQAMVDIDQQLMRRFPDCRHSHSHSSSTVPNTTAGSRSMQPPTGAYLVLQLHDELVYEVSLDILPGVASLVKTAMEGAAKLCVTLPVKIKVGPSWGELQDYDL